MKISKPFKSVLVVTIISCLLFCSTLMVISLSPLSDMGKHANQFNSVGMWLSVGIIFVSYLIPLVIYSLGVEWIKYLMTVFCFLGLLISIGITVFIVAVDHFEKDIFSDPTLIASMICVGLLFMTNLIWFFVTFLPSSKDIKLEN